MSTEGTASGILPSALVEPLVRSDAREHLGLYGVHVFIEGVGEREHRFRSDDFVHVFSCSKTFTALAIGMLVGSGDLGVQDRLVEHVTPVAAPARGVEEITVEHLLTMTSGSSMTCFTPEEKLADDVAAAFLTAPLTSAPGERFAYSNGSTYMLARIVEHVTGEDLRDFLMPRLFEPMGILNPQWFRCRRGHSWGAFGLHLRTSELARLGRLLLQRGVWDARTLVPEEWVDAMHGSWIPTDRPEDPEVGRYGYQVWKCSPAGAWRADGNFGQFSVVLPEERSVITVTAHLEGGRMHAILPALWRDVLPAVRELRGADRAS